MIDIDTCFKMVGDTPTTLTFIYLVHMADEEGKVNATYDDMVKALNRPKTTIYRYVTRLIEMRLVEQRWNKGGTKVEQKRASLYVPQVTHYKQVECISKNVEWNKGGTKVEQRWNNTVSTKRTLEDRKRKFYDALIPYLEKYDKKMIREFFDYWSQVNEGGSKMHFEKQKTFEIGKRLATWKRNEVERQHPQRAEDIGVVLAPTEDKFKNEEVW